MSLREELIQVAAVAIAMVTDLDQGSTRLIDNDGYTVYHKNVITDVVFERGNQEAKWGLQHHSIAEWLAILGEEYGEACKSALDDHIFPKGPE